MSILNKNISKEIMYTLLFNEHKTLFFTRTETAKLLNRSIKTLDNMREAGRGPEYQKDNTPGGKGAVMYPIQAIVEFKFSHNYRTLQ